MAILRTFPSLIGHGNVAWDTCAVSQNLSTLKAFTQVPPTHVFPRSSQEAPNQRQKGAKNVAIGAFRSCFPAGKIHPDGS